MNNQFIALCKEGKLDELKEMYQMYGPISFVLDSAFYNSCYSGHLNVVQWLYSLGGINIHSGNDFAFRISCRYGSLNIAQWLYSFGNINIHAENDYAFRMSCYIDRLDIAQWLYSLGGVNIHIEDDSAFEFCCKFKYLNIVHWLLLIDKFNDKIVDEFLPHQSYEYAFSLGYLPVDKMIPSYVEYKNKIKNEIKENNKNGNISIFELSYLVDIITAYV